jgi:hypothetical protein
MPVGEMNLTWGNVVNTFILKTTLTPTSLTTGVAAQQTFTVNGLQLGDQISDVSLQGAWTVAVTITNAWVSANNTLAVSFANATAGTLTPPSGTYYIEVNRPDLQNLPPVIQ